MRHCLCDPTFSHFNRTLTCDRQTYDYCIYHASMALPSKKLNQYIVTVTEILQLGCELTSYDCKSLWTFSVWNTTVKIALHAWMKWIVSSSLRRSKIFYFFQNSGFQEVLSGWNYLQTSLKVTHVVNTLSVLHINCVHTLLPRCNKITAEIANLAHPTCI